MGLLVLEQTLNGLQFALLLFLLAAGLTLIFGVMDVINLAHGALYMMGAFFAAAIFNATDNFLLAFVGALILAWALGMATEALVIRRLYARDHLDQVLATFGLILFFNEAARLIWGPAGLTIALPEWAAGSIAILPGLPYPTYRLLVIIVGVATALGLGWVIARTRLGMLIRAGASNRAMVEALGVNIAWLYTVLFGLGAALAALAGVMAAPITTAQIGMGDRILITALVVVVIGGLGSIRGAFLAALFVGFLDSFGRAFLPDLLRVSLGPEAAATLAPALASMSIYILMALVLAYRPQGLLPARGS